MKNIWITIKENKVATIAIVVVIGLLIYIFRPVKVKRDESLNEGVARIIDSVIQINNFKLIQQQQEMKRSVDSALKVINVKDAKIVERIFYRDQQLRAIDDATDDVMQGLFNDRHAP